MINKTFSKLEMEENLLNLRSNISKKPRANITFNGETEHFLSKIGNKELEYNIVLKCHKARKINKMHIT